MHVTRKRVQGLQPAVKHDPHAINSGSHRLLCSSSGILNVAIKTHNLGFHTMLTNLPEWTMSKNSQTQSPRTVGSLTSSSGTAKPFCMDGSEQRSWREWKDGPGGACRSPRALALSYVLIGCGTRVCVFVKLSQTTHKLCALCCVL